MAIIHRSISSLGEGQAPSFRALVRVLKAISVRLEHAVGAATREPLQNSISFRYGIIVKPSIDRPHVQAALQRDVSVSPQAQGRGGEDKIGCSVTCSCSSGRRIEERCNQGRRKGASRDIGRQRELYTNTSSRVVSIAKLFFYSGCSVRVALPAFVHANRVPLLRPGQAPYPSYLGLPLNSMHD